MDPLRLALIGLLLVVVGLLIMVRGANKTLGVILLAGGLAMVATGMSRNTPRR